MADYLDSCVTKDGTALCVNDSRPEKVTVQEITCYLANHPDITEPDLSLWGKAQAPSRGKQVALLAKCLLILQRFLSLRHSI